MCPAHAQGKSHLRWSHKDRTGASRPWAQRTSQGASALGQKSAMRQGMEAVILSESADWKLTFS